MPERQNIHNRTLPAEKKKLIFTLFSKQNNLSRIMFLTRTNLFAQSNLRNVFIPIQWLLAVLN